MPEDPIVQEPQTRVMRMVQGAKDAEPPHPMFRWPFVAAGLAVIAVAIWSDVIYPTLHPNQGLGWSWQRTLLYVGVGLILIVGVDAVNKLIAALTALRKA